MENTCVFNHLLSSPTNPPGSFYSLLIIEIMALWLKSDHNAVLPYLANALSLFTFQSPNAFFDNALASATVMSPAMVMYIFEGLTFWL